MAYRVCVDVNVGPDNAQKPEDFWVNDIIYFSGRTKADALFEASEFLAEQARKVDDLSKKAER